MGTEPDDLEDSGPQAVRNTLLALLAPRGPTLRRRRLRVRLPAPCVGVREAVVCAACGPVAVGRSRARADLRKVVSTCRQSNSVRPGVAGRQKWIDGDEPRRRRDGGRIWQSKTHECRQ